ncbi:hypothetical protein OsI_16550 [Oryza sativa Indica Group]|uniref:Uncharacterized protein n=1 Tax=Oryza sativa subsp. indica TaxID=39946 RepID=B8ARC8_ORYSI|nr:hypothetical protein OsI_16550 [Oryza sativa Indica Group]
MACHAAALLQHPPPPPPPPPASLPSTACTSSSRRRASPWGGAGRLIRLRLRGHCPSPASARAARVVSPRCSSYGAAADAGESPAEALRRVLESPGAHQAPACYDALSARLVGRAGFKVCFTSGFSISAARLGLPDVGLISYGEMIDQGCLITEAASIPVIGDADNGYGNCMNVKRTVKGFIKAGFAGIILEDQVSPKACGHTQGRKVVSREEAIMHIKAAVDARKESGSDIVIVARTDSRQALSLDEALWRVRAFADAGADVLFIDALASREEMKAFCAVSPGVPKMANMLEGGGKTPILSPAELEETGYKLIAYPLSLIGVSMRAMELYDLGSTGGRGPSAGMWSRTLRLRITGRDGVQKIDARIPAGFLEGMTKVIPGLAGANIMERLRNAPIDSENPQNGQILLDFEDAMGDRIQVFIE